MDNSSAACGVSFPYTGKPLVWRFDINRREVNEPSSVGKVASNRMMAAVRLYWIKEKHQGVILKISSLVFLFLEQGHP